MVKLGCRLHLDLHVCWLAAVFLLFASPLLSAQDNPSTIDTNSIFNATIDLHTNNGVIKSENDKRNYRYLTLENQLGVLLISDPSTEKSAAALDVNVGANQNPVDRAGLAHFLEHMLFLGTEKYPQAGEYQEFISQHGGKFNAYTAAENTNYFFEIDNDQLDVALDRFAQFFISPLFNPEYVERERNAVHSEYLAKLKDDGRREKDVYRELFNPDHPSANFSVGNLMTLADREGRPVREDMVAFYQQYYSSHLMNLSVSTLHAVIALEGIEAKADPSEMATNFKAAHRSDALTIEGAEYLILTRDELELLDEDFAFLLSQLRGRIAGYHMLVRYVTERPLKPDVTREAAIADMTPVLLNLALHLGDTICRLAAAVNEFDPRMESSMRAVVAQWATRMPVDSEPDLVIRAAAEAGADCPSP